MIKEFMDHRLAYVVLCLIIIAGVVGYLLAWPQAWWQRVVALVWASSYFVWGLVFHLHSKKITKQVIWEYAFFSMLILTMLSLLTV